MLPLSVLFSAAPSSACRRTVQGNCTSPPPASSTFGLAGPGFADWRAPQCVIINDHSLFRAIQPLWMDALYLRLLESRNYRVEALIVREAGELYATRMTIHGPGLPRANTTALFVRDNSKLYVEGVDAVLVQMLSVHCALWGCGPAMTSTHDRIRFRHRNR